MRQAVVPIPLPSALARPLAIVLCAVALSACAARPGQVDVTVGVDIPQVQPSNNFAALYVPYAMMAASAYAEQNVLTQNHCPDIGRLGVRQPGDSDEAFAFNKTVRGWVAYLNRRGWQCRFGVAGSLPCPPRLGLDCKPVSGLGFHVWRRMQGGVCRDVVIVFRGTDRNDRGDWTSNFRFLYRLAPRFDQYDQVRTHIRRVIKRIKERGCNGALFVATGHSLGGGLAQQAAYADGSIRYVYAFDSSPVTGIFDVSAIVRERNVQGLGIDRAYEAGEILVLPRIVMENIIPPLPCSPRTRTVRFNFLMGSPIAQHSIAELTGKLREAAATPGADPRRAIALHEAQTCTEVPVPPFLLPPA